MSIGMKYFTHKPWQSDEWKDNGTPVERQLMLAGHARSRAHPVVLLDAE